MSHFKKAANLNQALESDDAKNLKKSFDDLIKDYTKSQEK